MLAVGTKVPDFKLKDQNGLEHSLSYHKGQLVLVYFYPKDDTSGCTKEACAIRDMYNDFERAGVKVFGVSHDTVESHKKFEEKYKLPFILLSDPKKEVIKAYGALGGIFTKRISYLIGKDGKILKAYPKVDPTIHAGEILKDIYDIESK
ncbi:MAG: peroxiredoxin [Patescibacteria group bacterium]|nr:peroxiredoxin [Patescibacteria group bacterium]MDE1946080.1 peroxiredoxin [Patescibacteria group bacterium]